KLVAGASTADLATGDGEFVAARYTADGVLDPTFGTGGIARTSFPPRNGCEALGSALTPDGMLVVAGMASAPDRPAFDFALARFQSDGSLDTSFGDGGRVVTEFPDSLDSQVLNVVVQPDGRIVASGFLLSGAQTAIVRYMPDGTLDPSFGGDGVVIEPEELGRPVRTGARRRRPARRRRLAVRQSGPAALSQRRFARSELRDRWIGGDRCRDQPPAHALARDRTRWYARARRRGRPGDRRHPAVRRSLPRQRCAGPDVRAWWCYGRVARGRLLGGPCGRAAAGRADRHRRWRDCARHGVRGRPLAGSEPAREHRGAEDRRHARARCAADVPDTSAGLDERTDRIRVSVVARRCADRGRDPLRLCRRPRRRRAFDRLPGDGEQLGRQRSGDQRAGADRGSPCHLDPRQWPREE